MPKWRPFGMMGSGHEHRVRLGISLGGINGEGPLTKIPYATAVAREPQPFSGERPSQWPERSVRNELRPRPTHAGRGRKKTRCARYRR